MIGDDSTVVLREAEEAVGGWRFVGDKRPPRAEVNYMQVFGMARGPRVKAKHLDNRLLHLLTYWG